MTYELIIIWQERKYGISGKIPMEINLNQLLNRKLRAYDTFYFALVEDNISSNFSVKLFVDI